MLNIIFSMMHFNIPLGYSVFTIHVLVEIVDSIPRARLHVVIGKERMSLMDFLANENN